MVGQVLAEGFGVDICGGEVDQCLSQCLVVSVCYHHIVKAYGVQPCFHLLNLYLYAARADGVVASADNLEADVVGKVRDVVGE